MIWIETSRRRTGFYQLLTFSPRVLVFTLFVLRTFSQTKENHKLNLIVNFEPPQCEYCPVISPICIQHIYLHFRIFNLRRRVHFFVNLRVCFSAGALSFNRCTGLRLFT